MIDHEIATPLEISDLRSKNGDIMGMVKLKSGNYGVGAYSFVEKKWIRMDIDVGQFTASHNGISSDDDVMIKRIRDEMTEEMVENEVYHKYFKKR